MDEKKIEVLPNHKEISELANALYRKQDEFDLSNPYEVGYVLINKLGYRKESDTAREILECLRFLIEERNCVGGYDLEDETIDGTIFVEILNELKERYGVEVE